MNDNTPPRPPPPGFVPIFGTVGENGRVILRRPLPRPR